MKFASLGSGSKGNATLVEDQNSCVLIDCGFSITETEKRLQRLSRAPEDLTAILVTHEHGDHLRGVLPLARKYKLPVFMTAGTAKTINKDVAKLSIINSDATFKCGSLTISAVTVPHDAREPVQFILSNDQHSLGVLTDLGHISEHVIEQYSACDGLLLEANHDSQMLAHGPYPSALKKRVGGNWGHLNNNQSRQLLNHLELPKLQQLVLGHISEKNNLVEKVRDVMVGLEEEVAHLHYACQSEGFSWLELM